MNIFPQSGALIQFIRIIGNVFKSDRFISLLFLELGDDGSTLYWNYVCGAGWGNSLDGIVVYVFLAGFSLLGHILSDVSVYTMGNVGLVH